VRAASDRLETWSAPTFSAMRLIPLFLALLALAPAAAAPPKIRVLIIDGINNHDWPPTTAWLQAFLLASERCTVEVSTTPPREAPAAAWAAWRPNFSAYNVVLSNWNGGHQPDAIRWPPEVEAAFERYVRGGGGFVSFHAANNAFLGWPAYNEMVGLLWRDRKFGPGIIVDDQDRVVVVPAGEGRNAGHPPRLDFVVTTLPADHPITRGFPKKWRHPSEQLTHGQHGLESVVRGGALTILTCARDEALGENEPMDWVRTYGRGRVYVTMLGHTWKNEPSPNLRCAGFQTLLLRGVEWAATGNVTVPMPADFPSAEKISVRD
jgi:uncharacterized protein